MSSQPCPKLAIRDAPGPDLRQFEDLDFDTGAFDHQAHLYVAWSYLRECDLAEAIERYGITLRKLTARLGVPDKYHETITWFFLIAVSERMDDDRSADWPTFRARNPELFGRSGDLVRRYYSPELLGSQRARRQFVLPDLPGARMTPAATAV